MPVILFITIDTEEDTWNDYSLSWNPTENIKQLYKVQDMFDAHGVTPTYLINYPVATNNYAINYFKALLAKERCEIGTHCHPWNTPPFFEGEKNNINLCNLPYEIIQKKMDVLHETIIQNIGIIPLCFRAGRWAFNTEVAQVISKLGYEVDTSVTPFTNWKKKKGQDFSDSLSFSHWIDLSGVENDHSLNRILEVPMTIGFFQRPMRFWADLRKWLLGSKIKKYRILGVMDKLGIMNYRWLSPEVSTGKDMIRLTKNFIRTGHQFLNMSFHSNSLLPGQNPFVENEKKLEDFLNRIRVFLEFIINEGIVALPLRDALKTYQNKNV